jgi:CBS domain-containing protein
MGKRVRDAMTTSIRTASASQSLSEVAQMMRNEDAGSIPVVEDGHLIGIVTDRDITVRAVAAGVDPKATRIGDFVSRDLVTVEPGEDLDEAVTLMAGYQLRRLPVVEEDGQLVGILAQADVALEVKEKRAGEVLAGISQPEPPPQK